MEPSDKDDQNSKNKIEIQIIYNGLTKEFEVQPHEQLTAVVARAAHIFGITQNVHTLALFRTDGTEIVPLEQSVAAAGIKPHELLALRPSTVRGG